jgi:hypothetical protein
MSTNQRLSARRNRGRLRSARGTRIAIGGAAFGRRNCDHMTDAWVSAKICVYGGALCRRGMLALKMVRAQAFNEPRCVITEYEEPEEILRPDSPLPPPLAKRTIKIPSALVGNPASEPPNRLSLGFSPVSPVVARGYTGAMATSGEGFLDPCRCRLRDGTAQAREYAPAAEPRTHADEKRRRCRVGHGESGPSLDCGDRHVGAQLRARNARNVRDFCPCVALVVADCEPGVLFDLRPGARASACKDSGADRNTGWSFVEEGPGTACAAPGPCARRTSIAAAASIWSSVDLLQGRRRNPPHGNDPEALPSDLGPSGANGETLERQGLRTVVRIADRQNDGRSVFVWSGVQDESAGISLRYPPGTIAGDQSLVGTVEADVERQRVAWDAHRFQRFHRPLELDGRNDILVVHRCSRQRGPGVELDHTLRGLEGPRDLIWKRPRRSGERNGPVKLDGGPSPVRGRETDQDAFRGDAAQAKWISAKRSDEDVVVEVRAGAEPDLLGSDRAPARLRRPRASCHERADERGSTGSTGKTAHDADV